MLDDPIFLVAVNLLVAVFIRMMLPNLASNVLLAVVIIASTGYMGSQHGSDVLMAAYKARDKVLTASGSAPHWPPEKLRQYPDLELIDQDGRITRLSEFRGKVILIHAVGMPSEASVAFAGGHDLGAFAGIRPQANLDRIAVYARQFGQIELNQPELVIVHLILFNQEMRAPDLSDLRRWADHFHLRRDQHRLVLAATPEMATFESHGMVPGFQLIDKRFVLRADATGSQPQDSLYTDLLPMIRYLIREEA